MADSRDRGDGGQGLNVGICGVVVDGVLCVIVVVGGGLFDVMCELVVGEFSVVVVVSFDGLNLCVAASPTTERCTNTRSAACLTFAETSSSLCFISPLVFNAT